ncbi:aldo/keto reductase [Streptomyces mirabilis]|jgi:aryl-alcohol dehydrogenase-like predicted oxidoreductase|uniref:Predicted oxidoreductase n=1 Tax=Streptomyces mirabilis TaxID=68239 RepID=A0A1I2Y936_9ACTN|nr:aldo/keto reductase [Streptomyces mirabilis]SFH21887.1 Predicted oxidoreductase [Streptomyces mirabilis]
MLAERPLELVGQVALGGVTFSLGPDRKRSGDIATIRAAADAGIRIFDSARVYAPVDDPQHNERLFAHALKGRSDVLISTQGGHFRTGQETWDVDNSAARLRQDVAASLDALGVERIGLYYLHRADAPHPIGESVSVLDEMRREGKIQRIGLSNVTAAQLEEAHSITSIDAVQNHHGVAHADSSGVLRLCEKLSIPFFAYYPLRRDDGRPYSEGFPRMGALAADRVISLARLLLRALLESSPVMSVVSGASRAESAMDSAAALTEVWDEELESAWQEDVLAMRT